jgi:tetratricopeptide (TPR) repeat protein
VILFLFCNFSCGRDAAIDAFERGFALHIDGNLDGALAHYNEAIRLDPKYASVYVNRGVIYLHTSDYDRAMQDFNYAIYLDPFLLCT